MPNEEAIQKMSIVDPIQVNVNIPNFEGKPGRDGTDGRDGDDAYRIAVRNGFLGTEKEWLLTLKGQDGKSASAPTARQTLLQNNVWCEDDTVDSVFAAIIGNWGKPMPRTDYRPIALQSTVLVGSPNITFSGEPHFKVKIDNKTVEFNSTGLADVTVSSSNTGDSYVAQYFGYTDNHLSDINVAFGNLSSVFDKGSLVETTELRVNSDNPVRVSIYDNKVVELTHTGENYALQPPLDANKIKKIKDYVLTKINDIDTLIVDDVLTATVWVPFQNSFFGEITQGIGHGVNLRLDLSYYKTQGYGRNEERLFNRVSSSDRYSKDYIGKAIQIGTSNVMILKPTGSYIIYRYSPNTILESSDSL